MFGHSGAVMSSDANDLINLWAQLTMSRALRRSHKSISLTTSLVDVMALHAGVQLSPFKIYLKSTEFKKLGQRISLEFPN